MGHPKRKENRRRKSEEKVPSLQAAGRMMLCFGSALSCRVSAVLLCPGHSASQFRVCGKNWLNVFSCGGNVYRLKNEVFTMSFIELNLWC